MKKYSEIKQKTKIDTLKDTDGGAAYFTHYLHNKSNNKISKYFKQQAKEFLENKVEESLQKYLSLDLEFDIPFPEPKKPKFTFIDLFAGVGGIRIAMQNLGGKCVFSSEIDKYAKKTYELNFGEVPFGDITKINEKNIPEHEILCAGFPCQAFSIAGKRKGFDETRGTLFFDIKRILIEKQPKAFFLENVKGLRSHDRGRTINIIQKTLKRIGYSVNYEIINAKNFGVPQNRERIFIIGFRNDLNINDFKFPEHTDKTKTFSDVKEKKEVSVRYYLSDTLLNTLRKHKERHSSKGNGFGCEIIDENRATNAILVGGMGKERNLIVDKRLTNFIPETKIKGEVNKEFIRRMTPREWARLQGFDDNFLINVSDAQAYKQFGNSVAIPAIQATAKNIIDLLKIKLK